MAQVVVGIDGGGTYTRVVVADLRGNVLARMVSSAAASPHKSASALENVRAAIEAAIAQAGCAPGDVAQLVAGFAGLDDAGDQEWAQTFTALPGLTCPRLHVNDAVVAHAGALESRPGVIAIAGTGSIVLGVTETGEQVRNYDFLHYADSSARALSFAVVYRILAGEDGPQDRKLVADTLAYWQVDDRAALRSLGRQGFTDDRFERIRRFGEMAPLVTGAASAGVPLARLVCDTAVAELATGIRLVGSCFAEKRVEVAPIGGAIRSPYLLDALRHALARSADIRYELVEPALPPEIGAVLMALARLEGKT